jgi:homopolymeric O-antigen transport system ATP-binding protein
MKPAIRVENLSKQYRIGTKSRGAYHNLTESIVDGASAVWCGLTGRARGGDGADEFWALKDVSFEVQPGEVVGIIGRNGAGKSTLLKILSRIAEPTSGRAVVRGRMGSLLEVGTGFHPELTGRENIYLNGSIMGMSRPEIDRKFDEIVAFSEIEQFLDTPVKRYSSGMYVRLAFAVAAHLDLEILLVDEVLAVGDIAFQKKCLGKMQEVAGNGRTVLFVSHNIGLINSLCDMAVYLSGGKVKAMGLARSIVTEYLAELFQAKVQCLEQLRVAGTGEDARFQAIELGPNGRQRLGFGQSLDFQLRVQSSFDFRDLSIGSSVYNSDGTCVGTLFTPGTFSVKAGQPVLLLLTVKNPNLAPGSYYCGFSLGTGGHGGNRRDLDIVIGKPAFEVLPVVNDTDPVAEWNRNWGNIVFRDVTLAIDESLS